MVSKSSAESELSVSKMLGGSGVPGPWSTRESTYNGPATDAMPYIPPIIPMYAGLFLNGTVFATIKMAPLKIPAAPTPAIARPIISAVEFGATPQTSDPSSKMARAER